MACILKCDTLLRALRLNLFVFLAEEPEHVSLKHSKALFTVVL